MASTADHKSPHDVPALADLLGMLDQEEQEEIRRSKIVLHEDAVNIASKVASHSIDQLLWESNADMARAVVLCGPGIVMLPMFGHIAGINEQNSLGYDAYPDDRETGVLDRELIEQKLGPIDPQKLLEELSSGERSLNKRLAKMKTKDLRKEILALQEWRRKANGRLRTLEKRTAWAFLGIPFTQDEEVIKRAFKKKALELHPDKGGNAERFQMLQEMKDLLLEPRLQVEDDELEKDGGLNKDEMSASQEDGKKDSVEQEEDSGGKDDESGDDSEGEDVDQSKQKKTKKRKGKRRKGHTNENESSDELDVNNPERPSLEASRRKISQNIADMWRRATKLAGEIKALSEATAGPEPLRTLRRFVTRFASMELATLQPNDTKKAERLFRRFLEQGSEILCAAGAVDPVATVSEVAVKINCQLLATAPSPQLEKHCASLVDAIKSMPLTFERFINPVESSLEKAAEQHEDGKETAAEPVATVPIQLRLSRCHSQDNVGSQAEVVEREMSRTSTIGALRLLAQHAFHCRGYPQMEFAGCPLEDDEMDLGNLPEMQDVAIIKVKFQSEAQPESDLVQQGLSIPVSCTEAEIGMEVSSDVHVQEPPAAKTDEELLDGILNVASAAAKAALQAAERRHGQERCIPSDLQNTARVKEQPLQTPLLEETGHGRQHEIFQSLDRISTQEIRTCEEDRDCPNAVQQLRTEWDRDWEHSCAGPKRTDGSAIFCDPCNLWVTVPPFDHQAFELHCEKAGHTDWID